ncbi:R2-like ligand-binding oxidase [Rhodohalobacter sp.]|uniref:R2-like ligand-binding oxidase n=1 Tax=Rhodohalobacter sp. TaxID=1974210 RepID=UPI002ACD969A|nr:R2-like ligand-binding oxidase [Rhodohalobacter sp.]MDZ7754922.1 R2-like ligand-binding oxidase [Rhodohalobacter sp.]
MWFGKKSKEKETGYFSEDWLIQWKENINSSKNYANQGKSWNAPIILKITSPTGSFLKEENITGIFLDLKYGKCEEIRYSKKEDEVKSDVILKAKEETWIRLIEKDRDPTKLIMLGKIKLEKGSLVMLSIQRKAAIELIKAAPSSSRMQVSDKDETSQTREKKSHKSFKTTQGGINHNSFPMKLFQKAKQFGIWNPSDINLSTDAEQWTKLTQDEKEIILHLTSLFITGEEAVTSDLLPLMKVISNEGRLEEEIFLTSFLWEEAKHVEFFSLYQQEVFKKLPDAKKFHGPFYKTIFYEKLPDALSNLDRDPSPLSQLKASITYNMIVEGTLAETGYAAFYNMLEDKDLLPGLREGLNKLKQDESRHIAFGLYLINRILDENPEYKETAEDLLTTLLNDTTNIIHEIFEPYDVIPFNLEKEWFLNYAIKQFQLRIDKLGISV